MHARKDAVDILKDDHRHVKGLFDSYATLCADDASGSEKSAMAGAICLALSIHAQVEEELFYPAVRAALGERAMLDLAEVEHSSAKDLISRISAMRPPDPLYDALVAQLGRIIELHVRMEEDLVFVAARRSRVDLSALGDRIEARKIMLLVEYRRIPGGALRYDIAGDPIGRRALLRSPADERMRARVTA